MPRAQKALGSLPWVEPASVQIDLSREQVRFRVAAGAAFDEGQLSKAFADAGWKIKVLSAPAGP